MYASALPGVVAPQRSSSLSRQSQLASAPLQCSIRASSSRAVRVSATAADDRDAGNLSGEWPVNWSLASYEVRCRRAGNPLRLRAPPKVSSSSVIRLRSCLCHSRPVCRCCELPTCRTPRSRRAADINLLAVCRTSVSTSRTTCSRTQPRQVPSPSCLLLLPNPTPIEPWYNDLVQTRGGSDCTCQPHCLPSSALPRFAHLTHRLRFVRC